MPHAKILIGAHGRQIKGAWMFADRRAAGRLLADALSHHAGANPIVLGLPRGGVPVADEVARMLDAPLDVWIVRKLSAPIHHEIGLGAVAEGPAMVIDRTTVRLLGVTHPQLLAIARREMAQVRRRVRHLRSHRPAPELRWRTVILVDDGIATGGTMRAAIRAVRKRRPARLVVATPVAAADVLAALRREVDEVVCLHRPKRVYAVGLWYVDHRPIASDEVARILERARAWSTTRSTREVARRRRATSPDGRERWRPDAGD